MANSNNFTKMQMSTQYQSANGPQILTMVTPHHLLRPMVSIGD